MNLSIGMWNFVAAAMRLCTKNDSLRQFLELPFPQQQRLLSYLAQAGCEESAPAAKEKEKEGKDKVYFSWLYFVQGIRKHFQLPCSYATRKKRADWFEQEFSPSSRILLLGDDDLVAGELGVRGFSNVIVADCDPKILQSISAMTESCPQRPKLMLGNFLDRTFLRESGADVICIDPPYNLKWSRVFVEQALRSAGRKSKLKIVVMVNPLCFVEEDLNSLWQGLRHAGFALVEHRAKFNSYPLHGMSKYFLRFGLWLMPSVERHGIRGDALFFSDMFVFERTDLPRMG